MLVGRTLVTGGAGFLGSHLVGALYGVNVEVAHPTSAELDLRDARETRDYFAEQRPVTVFHLAARVGGIGANQAKPGTFFYENMLMGLNVIEAARLANVQKVIVVGTVCSYPRVPPRIPFIEDDLWAGYPEETNAPYGIAKKALLVMGQAYRQEFGLRVVHLIPTNLYGPRDNFDPATSHVIPAMVAAIVRAKRHGLANVTFWGDGTPTREFLYVTDCVEALLLAADRYEGVMPLNLGAGREVSMQELASMIADVVGWQGKVSWDHSRPNGQPRRAVSSQRASTELSGWWPKTTIQAGLQQTIAWYEKTKFRPQMGRP
jgi:GDP-L-fucose synthase